MTGVIFKKAPPLSKHAILMILWVLTRTVKIIQYRDTASNVTSRFRRQEAVDMLCDLAVRKLSPGTSSGSTCPRQSSGTSCNSPRRLRRPGGTRSSAADVDEGAPHFDSLIAYALDVTYG